MSNPVRPAPLTRRLAAALCLALMAPLAAACGSSSGGDDNGGGGGGFAPAQVIPGTTASESEQVVAFASTVQPMLMEHCSDCHAGSGPGTPHVAHPNSETAFHAVVDNQKANLAVPSSSRLVRRLVVDFHHCWEDCVTDGMQMQAAIAAWAEAIAFGEEGGTPVEGIVSGGLRLEDGIEDEGDNRYLDNVVAYYKFSEGEGDVVRDLSGVAPPMDLRLSGATEWLTGYGVHFMDGLAEASPTASRKLYDRIAMPGEGTQQFTLEAWLAPDDVNQEGPAAMVGYTGESGRNFTLGQVLYYYNFKSRSLDPDLDENGAPALQTADADEDLQAELQHVVVTYDQYRGRRIYVNGIHTEDPDEHEPSRLWNWDPEHVLRLGADRGGRDHWEGQIRLLAIYEYVLSESQIQQNFAAGVGRRVVMRFDVSQYAGSGAVLEAQVSDFDGASYLVCQPTLIAPGAIGSRVSNLRIAVNGQAPVSGQAFPTVDTVVAQARQELSPTCSIILKDQGPDEDLFTVEFEMLGGFQDPEEPGPPPTLPPREFGEALPLEGTRNFERVRETMAELTGVDPTTPQVRDAFEELTEALPSGVDLRAFASSQQMAIARLSLEYCDAMVESPALRDAFFGTTPGFAFEESVPVAFAGPAERDVVTDALVDRMIGMALESQPSRAEVEPVLDELIDGLIAGCDAVTCGPTRTRTVVKAACSAVLASAAVTVH